MSREIRGFAGKRDDGWSFELILFRKEPRGELRFALDGVPQFVHPVGIEEIAMFGAKRWDLVADYVTQLLAERRPH